MNTRLRMIENVADLGQLRAGLPSLVATGTVDPHELVRMLLRGLLDQENGLKDESFKTEIVVFIGEFCCEIMTSFRDLQRVFNCLLEQAKNCERVDVVGTCLSTCTALAVCLQHLIKREREEPVLRPNGRTRSRTSSIMSGSSDSSRKGAKWKFEAPLLQMLLRILTSKDRVDASEERVVLQCLVEMELNLPGILSSHLNTLFAEYKACGPPNRQLWNVLLLLGVRNLLKCVLRSKQSNQKGISSVLSRGVSLPESFTNISTDSLQHFYRILQTENVFLESNAEVEDICGETMQCLSYSEPSTRLQSICYLSEIKQMYRSLNERFFTSLVTQLSKRDSLCLSVAALAVLKVSDLKSDSKVCNSVLSNFGQASKVSHRYHTSTLFYLKFCGEAADVFCSVPSKRIMRPILTDKNAIIFEKISLYVLATSKTYVDNIPYQFFSLIKLFQRQIDRNGQSFVFEAIARILLLAYLSYESSERYIQVIVLELVSKHAFFCDTISQLLQSVHLLKPRSTLPDSCLAAFNDHITKCSFQYFLPRFTDYLPMMSLVAAKSSADLFAFLELLEKSLMLSDVCNIGSLVVGNGLIQIIRNILQLQRRELYLIEVSCLLQHISSNFDNVSVKETASLYWSLISNLPSTAVDEFFDSSSQSREPRKSRIDCFLTRHYEMEANSTTAGNELVSDFTSQTILIHKCRPNHEQVPLFGDDEVKATSLSSPLWASFTDKYLNCSTNPSEIQLQFEVSISPQAELSHLFALELLFQVSQNFSVKHCDAFLSFLHNSQTELVSVTLQVLEIRETRIPVSCVFNKSSLQSCCCPVDTILIKFHDYFLPPPCSSEIKSRLFTALWSHFKQQADAEHTEVTDVIYNVDHSNSFARLNDIILSFIPEKCVVRVTQSQAADGQVVSLDKDCVTTMSILVYLPPKHHLLIWVTHRLEFAVFHCVLTNSSWSPLLNNFLSQLETALRNSEVD